MFYECFSCLVFIKDPLQRSNKNYFQARNLHGWSAFLLISLQGVIPAKQRTWKNLCVSVSVHTSVMNGTLILIVLYNSQFDERFVNTPWRKVSRVVVDSVDLGGWVRMGEARKSS